MSRPLALCLFVLVFACSVFAQSPRLYSSDGKNTFLGNLNANPHDPDSIANPYGRYGSRSSPTSINNPYSPYGSPHSPHSARNRYSSSAPRIVAPSGLYLGRYSANRHAPDSIANPYGRYGSRSSPTSINNPYSRYGSTHSPDSARNPRGRGAPRP
ncbi:MAG: hypothetical protein M9913_18690 [Bryobacteraceae bacterium]|nr:hypothetical protein [Solibacteraceae bacterium]MCO5352888.1 hypothetical protein [Bryobacteraceae bacterium]